MSETKSTTSYREHLVRLIQDRLGEDAIDNHLHDWIRYFEQKLKQELV